MKIKLMSGYDVAKNYFTILNNYEKLQKNSVQTVSGVMNSDIPVYKKAEKVFDTFVKETEKAAKK